ncbi:hypothetical protein CHA01nite_05050 [Chryseobacterium hagamense]|uniref:Uncharacterized protein n=2 Tax=Chryseobacterium hagamense TaxID=395935 RepID=A0A511YHU0_9FLAO|nr:hypothetical protein CHA01nite_05050 [Chryseobacterium hagamense]
MKVRFKKDLSNYKNLDDYLVVGFGLHESKTRFYLIADDNFAVGYAMPKHFDIIDAAADGYIRRDDLNSGREFYLEAEMNHSRKDLRNYLEINDPYENVSYFAEKKYPVSVDYDKSMLNEDNKLSRIEGALLFINRYLYEQFWDDTYREGLEFYKKDSLDNLLEKRISEPALIQVSHYKDELLKFIARAFGAGEQPIDKSEYYARTLSGLISTLFAKEIASVQKIESLYDMCFVTEYENRYYILSRYWVS